MAASAGGMSPCRTAAPSSEMRGPTSSAKAFVLGEVWHKPRTQKPQARSFVVGIVVVVVVVVPFYSTHRCNRK